MASPPAEADDVRAAYEAEGARVERYASPSPWDRRYHRVRFAHVVDRLEPALRSATSFLDVGCGTGEYLEVARRLGVRATGVDLSHAYCARIRRARPATDVAQADATRLPFRDRAFDVVLCSEVIEHLPAAQCGVALDEVFRVAARAVILTTPNAEATIRRLGQRLAPRRVRVLDAEVGHVSLLGAGELHARAERDGWRAGPVAVHHVLPPVVGELAHLPPGLAASARWVERGLDRLAGSTGNTMFLVAVARPVP